MLTGAHGLDALLHFAVAGFRDRPFLAAHESGFGGDQVSGWALTSLMQSFAEVLAVGVVLGAVHFRVAALLAEVPGATDGPCAVDLPFA